WAVAFTKLDQIIVLNRVDEFVDEQLARKINHLGVFFSRQSILPDRLHQVRFTETDPAVNKKRIVRSCRRLCDRQTRRVRDFVVWSDDERFKCVPRIEAKRTAARRGLAVAPR